MYRGNPNSRLPFSFKQKKKQEYSRIEAVFFYIPFSSTVTAGCREEASGWVGALRCGSYIWCCNEHCRSFTPSYELGNGEASSGGGGTATVKGVLRAGPFLYQTLSCRSVSTFPLPFSTHCSTSLFHIHVCCFVSFLRYLHGFPQSSVYVCDCVVLKCSSITL